MPEDYHLPTDAELQRRRIVAEAHRFCPTRHDLDSMSISKDDCHTFTETPLSLPATRNERSTAAIIDTDNHEQIAIQAAEDMIDDPVDVPSWFDRVSATALPLLVGKAKPKINEARKKSLWELALGSPLRMSGLSSEAILSPEENESWAQEIGGTPYIRNPPKSSLNDKAPAFGIVWRNRKQKEEDLTPRGLASEIFRKRRPLASRTDLSDASNLGLNIRNISLLTKGLVSEMPASNLTPVVEDVVRNEEHSSGPTKDEDSGSPNPPSHPSGGEASSSQQPQTRSAEFEEKHQQRMTKCMFENVRPALQLDHHSRPREKNEDDWTPQIAEEAALKYGVRLFKEEEPLEPGAIRCPPSPRKGWKHELGYKYIPRHGPRKPSALFPSPREQTRGGDDQDDEVLMFEIEGIGEPPRPPRVRASAHHMSPETPKREVKDQVAPNFECKDIFGTSRVPQEHRPIPIRAQPPSNPEASPSPDRNVHPNTLAKFSHMDKYFYPGDKRRVLNAEPQRVIPRPPRREPLPVVDYVHNPDRHRKMQPIAEVIEATPQVPQQSHHEPVPLVEHVYSLGRHQTMQPAEVIEETPEVPQRLRRGSVPLIEHVYTPGSHQMTQPIEEVIEETPQVPQRLRRGSVPLVEHVYSLGRHSTTQPIAAAIEETSPAPLPSLISQSSTENDSPLISVLEVEYFPPHSPTPSPPPTPSPAQTLRPQTSPRRTPSIDDSPPLSLLVSPSLVDDDSPPAVAAPLSSELESAVQDPDENARHYIWVEKEKWNATY